MTKSEFKECVSAYYQTEVFGEAFNEALIGKFSDSVHRYKIATFLQLETETKARLRPTILELGGSVEGEEQSRQSGRELAESIGADNWQQFVSMLRDLGEPLLDRQREIAVTAPAPYRHLADSMREHGEAIQKFAEMEVAGESENSADDMAALLRFPFPYPQ